MPFHTREQSLARSGCTPGATSDPMDMGCGCDEAARSEPVSMATQRGIEEESATTGACDWGVLHCASGCDSSSLSMTVSYISRVVWERPSASFPRGCYLLSLHMARQQIGTVEGLLAAGLSAAVGGLGVVVQLMAPAVLSASEDLRNRELASHIYQTNQSHTLLQPGNSQAWTRLPFFALLMRWVVGV